MPDTTSYITAVETAIWNIWLEDGEWALVVKAGNRVRRDLGLDNPAGTNATPADFAQVDLIKGRWAERMDRATLTLGNESGEGCQDTLSRLRTQEFILTFTSATKSGTFVDWLVERTCDLLWNRYPSLGSDYVDSIEAVTGTVEETAEGTARGTMRLVATLRIALILRLPVGEVPAVTP